MNSKTSKAESNLILSELDWEVLLNSIKTENCILAIGPQILVDNEDQNILNKLKDDILEIIQKEYPDEFALRKKQDLDTLVDFLIKKVKGGRGRWKTISENLLRGDSPNSTFEKIAKIPFNLILSTAPDLFLFDMSNKLGFNLSKSYFKYKGGGEEDKSIKRPTKENPVLYSLFGNLENPDNIIFGNYSKLTTFISNYYKGEAKLPEKIEEQIKDAECCIFIGFDFSSWYFNVLLDALHIHINETNKNRWEANFAHPLSIDDANENTKSFYVNNFKMQFICSSNTSINLFLDELIKKCNEDAEIELRKKENNSNKLINSEIEEALELFKMNKLSECCTILLKYFSNPESKDSNILKSLNFQISNLNGLKENNSLRTISYENFNIEHNKIKQHIQEILTASTN